MSDDQGAASQPQPPPPNTADGAAVDPQQLPRFEVKKWNAVALWSWDVQVDTCAICRMHLMDLCVECQTNNPNATQETCTIVWGRCMHPFHNCCITKWLKTRNVCPLDNREWEYDKHGR